jgi:hypothetical protein
MLKLKHNISMNIEVNSLPDNQVIKNVVNNTKENSIEISNFYPSNLTKINLRADQRKLISYLRSEAYSICRTEIPYEYIKAVFNKFKNGFVYYKEQIPIAFCIWKVKEHIKIYNNFKELYIYLICGKQLDYKLVPRIIDDVVHLCRKSNINYITLEPANNILKDYYIKCGFKERYDIGNSKILELDVNNSRINPQKNKIFKTRKRRNKISNT